MTLYLTALRQQRLALVVWTVGLALMCGAIVSNAGAVVRTDIGLFLGSLPQAMRELMNVDLLMQRPLDGYLQNKLFFQMPLVVSIYTAFQAAGMVAREVERRQMDFVLSMPVSRTQLVWARLRALWTGSALLWAATLGALALLLAQQGYSGDWPGYLLAAWVGFLLNAALGALAMWASAGAGDYRRALRMGLGLTLALFSGQAVLQVVRVPVIWRQLLLYGLYDPGELILSHRIPWPEMAALILVAGAAAATAARTFDRREV